MTIDDVITRLTDITVQARRTSSRLGYFPALYRTVTIEVKQGIAQGRFEDGPRLERLDVLFASRYLAAFDAFQRGEPLSRSWRVAFDGAGRWRPIILQHLAAGINAHINLDLGIAAAEVAPGAALASLRRDFDEINVILGALIDDVQSALGSVSPWIRFLAMAGGMADDAVVGFNLKAKRLFAWEVAQKLAPLTPEDRVHAVEKLDLAVSLLGRVLHYPPLLTSAGLLVIRGRETIDPARVIDMLTRAHPLPD